MIIIIVLCIIISSNAIAHTNIWIYIKITFYFLDKETGKQTEKERTLKKYKYIKIYIYKYIVIYIYTII